MILLLMHLFPAVILKTVYGPPEAVSILQLSAVGAARSEVQGPYPAPVQGAPFRILARQQGWHPPAPDPNHSLHPAPVPPAARAWHRAGK